MIDLMFSVSTLLVDKEVKFGCTDDDEYARRIEVSRYIKEMQDAKLWEMKRFLGENPDSKWADILAIECSLPSRAQKQSRIT